MHCCSFNLTGTKNRPLLHFHSLGNIPYNFFKLTFVFLLELINYPISNILSFLLLFFALLFIPVAILQLEICTPWSPSPVLPTHWPTNISNIFNNSTQSHFHTPPQLLCPTLRKNNWFHALLNHNSTLKNYTGYETKDIN